MSVIGPSDFQGIAGNAQVKLSDQGIVTKSPNFFGRTLDKIHRSDAEKVSNKETRYRFAAMLVDKFGAIAARLAMGDLTSSAMAGKPLTGRHIQNILAQAEALTNRSRKSEAEAVDTIYPRQDAKPGAVLTDVKNASYDKIMSKINQFAGTHGLNPAEIGAIVSYTADPLNEIFNYTNINNALRKTFKTPTPGNDQERVDKQNAEKNFIESAKVARAAMRGLKKLPDYTGTVYRGMHLNPQELNNYIQRANSGNDLFEMAFVSTSADKTKSFPGNVKLEITSLHGKDVSTLSFFDDKEAEVLFAPGTRFHVDACIDEGNGKYRLKLTEVDITKQERDFLAMANAP